MILGIIRLYTGHSGKLGFYNLQELGLAKELVKESEIEVLIFLLRNKKNYPEAETVEIQRNIKIIYLPALAIGTHGIINPQFIKDYKLDVVQINSDIQLITHRMLKWCLKNRIPVYTYVGTVESDSENIVKRIVSKTIFKYSSIMMKKVHNVAKTPYVYKKMIENGITAAEIIPVGLDIGNLQCTELVTIEELREKYGIPKDKKVLLFVGRLEEYKKPLYSLEILQRLVKEDKQYHLIVVGNGSLRDKLLRKVEEKDLQQHFSHMESIPNKNIGELYRLSDCFLNLNDKEIYGMSILESMYCKCPVIAVRAPGPSYIIQDKKDGFLLNNYDIDEWILKIKQVLSNSTNIGENARSKVEHHLTWRAVKKKYVKLFKNLVVNFV